MARGACGIIGIDANDQLNFLLPKHDDLSFRSNRQTGALGNNLLDFVSEKTTQPHSILPSSRVVAFVDAGNKSTVNQVSQDVASHRDMTSFCSSHHIGAFGKN
jgi:hypothetical protein